MKNGEGVVFAIKKNTGIYNPSQWKELKIKCPDGTIIKKVNHLSNKFDVQIGQIVSFDFVQNKNGYYTSALLSKLNFNDFFHSDKNLKLQDDCYFFNYYTKRHNWDTCKNDNLVKSSRLALEFKESDKSLYFKKILKYLNNIILPNIVLCCVPSHREGNLDHSVVSLVKLLSKNGRIDGSSCLVRSHTIQKISSQNSDRSEQVHLNSIREENTNIFINKDVLLIDDVVTSGNSMRACSKILINPPKGTIGAKSVLKLAIWKTI